MHIFPEHFIHLGFIKFKSGTCTIYLPKEAPYEGLVRGFRRQSLPIANFHTMKNPSLEFDRSAQKASFDHKARTERQNKLDSFWKKSTKSQMLFQDYELICDRAAFLRHETLSQLDSYLLQFEAQFASYGQVHWLDQARDAQSTLERITTSQNHASKPLSLSTRLAPELGLSSIFPDKPNNQTLSNIIIVDAQFLIAESGQIALDFSPLRNHTFLNGLPDLIVLAGIEQVIPKLEHLGTFWPLLAQTQRAQVSLSAFQLIGNTYPGTCHLLLIDNGRSILLGKGNQAEALRCIHCGICQKKCPVIQTAGPEAFPQDAQSPIDWVSLAHKPEKEAKSHLNYSCTLCRACDEACPVRINLSEQILLNRRELLVQSPTANSIKKQLKPWKWIMSKRKHLNASRNWWKKLYFHNFSRLRAKQKMKLPEIAKKNLGTQWESEKGKEE